jgi:hypothetical protein
MHKVRESLFIVVVQVGAVKIYIYVAAVEALRKKERQDETQVPTKIDNNGSQFSILMPTSEQLTSIEITRANTILTK